ncbi:putative transporter C3H1.06c [Candida viswanathii]|uniref:Putative transporter C3H1.06c n=1 Tax=Candida viswanathii TaxID=5486 RepID=A0A367YK14_9ASCO|nr:putative transporter C3H1.06c [Candida viswanathii]
MSKSSSIEETKQLSDQLGDVHYKVLPTRKLIICLSSLSLALFASFVDQTGLTIALPTIGKDLNAQSTINWAPTASLLANTVCQVLFGRLSDIFGRKIMLLTCLVTLAFGDLICGFVKTGVEFYVFRAVTGLSCGGIQSLCMVILSDVVTLKQRGKYQGILGASVGLGNSVGPFIMSAFIERNSWRNFYHMMCPFVLLVGVINYIYIDTKEQTKELKLVITKKQQFKKLDYWGMLFGCSSITLLLIPISGGGSTYAWNSALVISMFVIGGGLFIGFLFVEWKIPELPMIPMTLFTRASLALILGSNFFFGMAYYGFTFYIAYYYQIVRGLDSIHSSILMLPLVIPQSIVSVISGQIISYTGHYIYVVIAGYSLWTLACGLTLLFDLNTNYGVVTVVLLLMGSGVACTFQPTMVAAQSQAKKSERAVVISCRNVIRSFGGAMGLAIASLIISNTLLREINQQGPDLIVPADYLTYMKTHIYSKIDTSVLTHAQVVVIRQMYMTAIRNFFYLTIPLLAICLITNMFVKDRGLQCIDEEPLEEK